MIPQEISKLLIIGDRALNTGDYIQAVIIFEQLYQDINPSSSHFYQIQRKLVKAYYESDAKDKAISLCQEIIATNSLSNKMWGEIFLSKITEQAIIHPLEQKLSLNKSEKPDKLITEKSLSDFKRYCQQNFLPQLKELEKQRTIALSSIFLSGIIYVLLIEAIAYFLDYLLQIDNYNPLLLIVAICIFPCWIFYCYSCIYVSKLNFKREIIENIVRFIDDGNNLTYANSLFIEDNHNTAISFGYSQLFRRTTAKPDFFTQEDCVFGKIGKTDIFFAEILVQKLALISDYINLSNCLTLDNNSFISTFIVKPISLIINITIKILYWSDQFMSEEKTSSNYISIKSGRNKKKIYRGLFFIARFPKSFKSRTFILSNNFIGKLNFETWRGQRINLEDSEFNRLFKVYGDSQIESRYILSTSLMERLIKFRKKARRNIRVSFIEGHVFIAIPYSRNLFEPKLFTSMLSFKPLREYFEILQLMIGIVQDLNLNQTIWKS